MSIQNETPRVTLLVFKDNETARTFQIPLGWIQRFGLLLSALVAFTLLASFFALKYYRLARKADPSHVLNLEQELGTLKASNRALETKLALMPMAPVAPALPTQAAKPEPTAPANPGPAAPPISASVGGVPLFTALPRNTQDLAPQAAKLPITVSQAKLAWSGKTLKVGFNLQYVATDGGSQQGRIIILARGPETLLGYPEGVLTRAGSESLVATEQGEYFSVSRFREANAEFGPVRAISQILDVEILILNLENQLIFYQKIPVPQGPPPKPVKAAPAPRAKPRPQPAAPAGESDAPADAEKPASGGAAAPESELIEPGVDQ